MSDPVRVRMIEAQIIEGLSPEVTLTPKEDGVEMAVTTKSGTKKALIPKGDTYELTAEDKTEIAQAAFNEFAEAAHEDVLEAEGHAVGKQDGTDVESGSPYYHNNAKYYAEQAAGNNTAAQAAKTAAQEAAATASAAYGTDLLAPDFSTSSTYAVGDYVIHSGDLYRCTTAVTTAGEWNNSSWTRVEVGGEVGALKSAVENVYGGTTYNLYRCINTTQTINGVTITTDISNNVKVSGTALSNGGRTLLKFGSTAFPAGTYYFSVTALGSPTVAPILTDSTMATVIYSGSSFTLADATDLYLVFSVVKNTTYDQSFKVQVSIESGSEIIPPVTAVDIIARKEAESANAELAQQNVKIDANTDVRNVVTGDTYNLYHCVNTSKVINNVTIASDIGNHISIIGTASANGGRTYKYFGSEILPAGTYYFSVEFSSSPVIAFMIVDSSDNVLSYANSSFILSASTEVFLVANTVKNTVYNTIATIQIVEGASSKPFVVPITAIDIEARLDIADLQSQIRRREIIVDVNGGGDYTSLSAAVQYAYVQGNYTIYVKPGIYNILNELDFTDKTALPGYGEGNNNAWGLKIGNNMRIICENNVVFSGLYDGTDFDIKTRFSMFNVTGNYELENMGIIIQNLRYCIHEDTPTLSLNQAYTSKIKNCRMHHMGGYTTSACLGCGDANSSLTIIEGGEYQSDDYDYPISMHNHTGNKDGRIILDGVYFVGTGTLRLAGLSGTSSGDTLYAMVRNCRLGANVYIDLETSKINLIQFGNTIG